MGNNPAGPKPYYNTGEWPDVWFEPTEVWELRGADLTLSPVHRAAIGHVPGSRGVGLRFPRFVRLRPDKAIEDATTPSEITALFMKQSRRAGGAGGGQGQAVKTESAGGATAAGGAAEAGGRAQGAGSAVEVPGHAGVRTIRTVDEDAEGEPGEDAEEIYMEEEEGEQGAEDGLDADSGDGVDEDHAKPHAADTRAAGDATKKAPVYSMALTSGSGTSNPVSSPTRTRKMPSEVSMSERRRYNIRTDGRRSMTKRGMAVDLFDSDD